MGSVLSPPLATVGAGSGLDASRQRVSGKSLNSPGRAWPADTEVEFCGIYRWRDGGRAKRKRKGRNTKDGEGRRGVREHKAPGRSICAKALMGGRPERWTSTISDSSNTTNSS